MNQLQIIREQEVLGKQFRVYGDFENPLFLAKDVAEWIEYSQSNISKLVSIVDENEKVRNIITTLGGNQIWYNSYSKILFSSKPKIQT